MSVGKSTGPHRRSSCGIRDHGVKKFRARLIYGDSALIGLSERMAELGRSPIYRVRRELLWHKDRNGSERN